GYVSPGEWIYRQVEDTNVEYEKFLAGDFTFITIAPDKQNEFRNLNESLSAEEQFQVLEYPSNSYAYVVWNQADPENPVNGRDENGQAADQGYHPIFSDKLVRQAMAHAIDVRAIIGTSPDENGDGATGILEGNGSLVTTHNHPGLSWVDPEQAPYAYDPVMALDLLEEAGWMDNDGDGLLECNDCLYAREVDAAYNGTPFEFELLTNSGNNIREGVGETMTTQLDELGITVDYQAIEFGTLVQVLLGQTYDGIIIGWSLGLPFDPDGRWALGSTSDLVGSGFNTGSYYNADLEAIWEAAVSVPGCDQEERAALYREAMNILYEDQPYLWLYAANTMVAAQPDVQNFDALPYNVDWNIDAWTIGD
ncbi:MAG: ABC transporter substrate-binding protein, partial [Aggregatilineales bacterium]